MKYAYFNPSDSSGKIEFIYVGFHPELQSTTLSYIEVAENVECDTWKIVNNAPVKI